MSLFPATARELSLDCSCPDGAVPCKHLAATFYLLAESFDEDPFAILAWRGREREDLLANLAAARSDGRPAPTVPSRRDGRSPTALTPISFGRPTSQSSSPPGDASTALLDQLPEITVGVRGRPLVELLRPAYAALSEGGGDR